MNNINMAIGNVNIYLTKLDLEPEKLYQLNIIHRHGSTYVTMSETQLREFFNMALDFLSMNLNDEVKK